MAYLKKNFIRKSKNQKMMKFFIIGLGSMGKRRVRNLQYLKAGEILGFDLRQDRRKEAEKKYGIKTFESFQQGMQENPDILIISTPPDKHNEYIKLAIENKKPAFVEASVILKGLEELNELAKKKKIFIIPSCTLKFHPAIKEIKKIVTSKKYGNFTNFSCHLGQYLPDWHPWENVRSFYAGKKATGGAREMVAFELTWLVDIFGFPKDLKGFYRKTMDIGADIDDTYAFSLDFGTALGNIVIDVVSRYATKSLLLNLERAQVLWRWDENVMKLYDAVNQKWIYYRYPKGKTVAGYNKNIVEDMYIEEMKVFINAIKGSDKFSNSLDEDIKVLKLLSKIEGKHRGFTLS